MHDAAAASRGRALPAIAVLGLLALVGMLAPVIANDRPILARRNGRVLAPALAELPFVGALFDRAAADAVDWGAPGDDIETLLMPPIPYSYRGIHLDRVLLAPGRRHLLGTDALGRDLLARLVHGTRPSLLVGLGATALALLAGALLGAAAGLRGGLVDLLIVRVVEIIACFPPFILALAFVSAAGHGGLLPIIMSIALSRSTGMARYIRGEILRRRGGDLWEAARATGASLPRVALRHLLPLFARPLAVLAAFGVAHAILLESGLSFLGLGVDPPTPSWGAILAEARATLDSAWWPVLFPSIALVAVLGALSLAGELAGARAPDAQDGLA
jgi:peptide/nickel transport system permease protein